MRDLSRIQTGGSPLRRRLLLILAVVILLSIGLYFLGLRFNLNLGGVGGSSVVLQEAPRGLTPVDVGSTETLADGGVDLTTQSAVFNDVKFGGDAVATATRSFGAGSFSLNVNATLPDPKNTYYQVWLVGGGEVVPIDYMRGSKTSWSLSLRSADKYSGYDGIWITLERSKDELPEEHVMEGSF